MLSTSKIALVLVSLGLVLSCSHSDKRTTASLNPSSPQSTKGRHLILTLHGVRGTEYSFGYFPTIIKHHLEQADPSLDVIPVTFIYQTGAKSYEPNQLTNDINVRILKELGTIQANDKISVVGYSMGGQVMGHWYFNTIFDEKTQFIGERVTNLVGLGSPYWGSKEAYMGIRIPGLDSIVSINPANMSGNEVRSLAVLSDSSTQLREKIIRWVSDPEIKKRFDPKILSIAGLFPCFGTTKLAGSVGCGQFERDFFGLANKLISRTYFSGLLRRETDMAVIVPSARWDFLYYSDKQSAKGQLTSPFIEKTAFRDIEKSARTEFIAAEAIHATVGDKFQDVVIVDGDCFDPKKCRHLTYKHIFDFLAGCQEPSNQCHQQTFHQLRENLFHGQTIETSRLDQDKVQRELHGFVLEFHIRVPAGYKLPGGRLTSENIFKYLKFNFTDPNYKTKNGVFPALTYQVLNTVTQKEGGFATEEGGYISTGRDFELQIGRNTEIESRMVQPIKDKDRRIVGWKIALTGRFILGEGYRLDNAEHLKTFTDAIWSGAPTVKFTVAFPRLGKRIIEAPLKPTASTYIDLELKAAP